MAPELSSKEKKRLDRFMRNVQRLASHQGKLPGNYDFIMRRQMRAILMILGHPDPRKILIVDALTIMRSPWPFKKYRLRKLIQNGRRRQ